MEFVKTVLTSLLSVVSLFLSVKFSGSKEISELDPFDFVSAITVGSIAAELATELEKPYKPLVALAVWFIVSLIVSKLKQKFQRSRRFLCGTPTILFKDGKFFSENMRKAKLDLSEFLMLCRQSGYFNLSDIRIAVFEFNGKISFLPTEVSRPANPADFGIIPSRDDIFVEIIMDGEILHQNLKNAGLDLNWLTKELSLAHISSPKEVFLALCDQNKSISVYRYRN